jgi:hypothetical protein
MTKEIVNPGNNGNLNDLLNKKFALRILVADAKSYGQVIDYLKGIAIKSGLYGDKLWDKTYYVFDEQKKQIARTDKPKRIIELTAESRRIKKGIEEIIYQ